LSHRWPYCSVPRAFLLVAGLGLPGAAHATEVGALATAAEPETSPDWYSLHFAATVASQFHPSFPATHSGARSLSAGAEEAHSVVIDLFAAARLWRGAEACFQPELAGGLGLSSTLGMADFPSGEVYRVGDPTPTPVVGRAYLRQIFGLGGGTQPIDSGPCEVAGPRDRNLLTLTLGRINGPDQFDNNPVSNDPHTRFTNWGFWASSAYDYAADTRGYTYGLTADLTMNWWSLRGGVMLEPLYANATQMDFDPLRSHSIVLEGEGRYTIGGKPGAARLLLFLNVARMGNYQEALEPAYADQVIATREYGRQKYGFAASANQDFGHGLSGFARVSADDGATESWAFTEVDRSLAIGVVQSGERWRRPGDALGVAVLGSLLSPQHRAYLAAGGLGYIIGDGELEHYGPELVGEVFYEAQLLSWFAMGADYQPVINPAYNRDRGPAHIFMLRATVAF
jgi:high affinity Mn2+ porin